MEKLSKDLLKEISEHQYDEILTDYYSVSSDSGEVKEATRRVCELINNFEQNFGNDRQIAILSGPGRTELAGNHTDHQLGWVICASVNLDILGAVSKNEKNIIRINSSGFEPVVFDLKNLRQVRIEKNSSLALVAGVIDFLEREGYQVGGFDAVFHSLIPSGSGLSSSAAYEILIGQILNYLYNDSRIDPVVLAKAGQFAENVYFGKPSGLMDQMGSSIGGAISIDFADPENLQIEKIAMDLKKEDLDLFIINTHSSHMDLTDEYASIPEEMKSVSAIFGKEVLSSVNENQVYEQIDRIRSVAGDRALLRSLHFLKENERVLKQKEALQKGDFEQYLKLVNDSGNSSMQLLQNIWSASNPREQSLNLALVLAKEILQQKGALRVHGGGFGGTIQVYIPKEQSNEFVRKMEKVFGPESCYRIKIRQKGGGLLIG